MVVLRTPTLESDTTFRPEKLTPLPETVPSVEATEPGF